MAKPKLALMSPATETEDFWVYQKEALSAVADVYTFDTTVCDDIGDMAELPLKQIDGNFLLAGLSMGGWVSLEIMKRAPERVEKLCLLNTSANGLNEATRPKREARVAELTELLKDPDPAELAKVAEGIRDFNIERLLFDANKTNPEVIKHLNYEGAARLQSVVNNMGAALRHTYDYEETLKAITCPTLIIGSEHDHVIPFEQLKSTIGVIPNSQIAVIENSGHVSALEQPEAVNALMRLWIEYM